MSLFLNNSKNLKEKVKNHWFIFIFMLNNTVIPNPVELEKIKKAISKDGVKGLHVISDFDRTLTKAFVNKKEIPSIISVLRDRNYLTKDYSKKAHVLFEKYHPIEINPNISLKEKKKTMYEWWTKHFDLLIKSGLNKRDLERVVESGIVRFREDALELIDFLNDYDIPLLILSSSGLGIECISMHLERERRLYNNIYIISNSFEWDKNGNAIGVREPIIHTMNKDETVLKDFPFFNLIKNRKNVLLLGDSLEDIEMVKGFNYKYLIKIGFLNKDVERNLEYYKRRYDVVILNDSNMNYVNNLLREIIC